MKKILILLSLLTATGALSQAQKPKDQNTIVAWSPGGAAVNFKKAVQVCVAQGFGIQYSDADMGVITTTMKATGGSSSARLNIIATDSTVVFRGQMSFDISIDLGSVTSEASLSELRNRGQKGSPARLSWDAMEKVAREVSDSLTYEIR